MQKKKKMRQLIKAYQHLFLLKYGQLEQKVMLHKLTLGRIGIAQCTQLRLVSMCCRCGRKMKSMPPTKTLDLFVAKHALLRTVLCINQIHCIIRLKYLATYKRKTALFLITYRPISSFLALSALKTRSFLLLKLEFHTSLRAKHAINI